MKPISFDGITFDSLNVSAGFARDYSGPYRSPASLQRFGASPSHSGVTQDVELRTVIFQPKPGYDIESTLLAALGKMDVLNPKERVFTALLNDDVTTVRRNMAIATHRAVGTNQIAVDFTASDPIWYETTETTTSITTTETAALAITNDGTVRAFPTIIVDPVTQRTTDTSSVGWKYRRQVTITNNSTEDWRGRPITVDLGDTAAWVTGSKAQADGDDVRVFYQGANINRTLTNFNTKRTWCHFLVSIKAGGSATYDFVYANTSATTATNMSTRSGSGDTYIGYDLEGDNGTATSGTTTTLTKTGAGWETDEWKGGFITLTGGTGSTRSRRVASNTSDTITFNRALATAPDATTTFNLWRSGVYVDGGRVTTTGAQTITDNLHTIQWGVNQLEGATVTFVGGGTASPATMTVASNTATTMTFTSSFSVQPTVGDSYTIERLGVWHYIVDTAITETAHRGMYRLNNWYSPAERSWPGELTPGGWGIDTYLDNDDDFRQYRPYNAGSGGGHSVNMWALLRASRRVRQTALYRDEGNGDGMSIYSPYRFQGLYWDKKVKNVNGVGMVVVAGKAPSGEDWSDISTYTTTQATLTDIAAEYIDLDAYGNPSRLGIFVAPSDGVEIPPIYTEAATVTARTASTVTDSSAAWATDYWKNTVVQFGNASTADPSEMTVASNTGTVLTFTTSFTTQPTVGDTFELTRNTPKTDEVEVRTNNTLILYLSLDGFGGLSNSIYTAGAETAVYDMSMILRMGGGADGYETPPYDRLVVGGTGHKLFIPLTHELWIRTDPSSDEPFAAIYSSDVYQYSCPWAVRPYHHEYDITGTDTALISRDILPIPPGNNLLTNPTFASNTTGWTLTQTTGTATWSRDAAIYKDAAGSLKCALNNSSTGKALSTAFTTVIGARYEVAFWWRADDVSVDELSFIGIAPGYQDTDTSTFTYAYNLTIYGGYLANETTSDVWWGNAFSFIAEKDSYSIAFLAKNSNGASSAIWIDAITVGPPNLYISESAMGQIGVSAVITQGYNG